MLTHREFGQRVKATFSCGVIKPIRINLWKAVEENLTSNLAIVKVKKSFSENDFLRVEVFGGVATAAGLT